MEASFKNTLINALGIKIIELSEERAVASMPVDERTRQPYGVLHGGASVALAETIASIGTYNLLDQEKEYCVGLEINANHIKSKKDGIVKAVATPLHKGRKTMVWDIKIIDEKAQLICVSRCTMAILPIQQ
nr:hotdog fold thioesterase [Litchfieldia alkalitelluris]